MTHNRGESEKVLHPTKKGMTKGQRMFILFHVFDQALTTQTFLWVLVTGC